MKKTYYIYVSAIIMAFAIISCNDETVVSPIGSPLITKISSDSVSIGDTVTILGQFFLGNESRYRVYIDTVAYINREDCLLWQNNQIVFVVPDSAISGLVKIKRDDLYSEGKLLNIANLPKFDVVEIPAGKFLMGSSTGFSNELPEREVSISKAFYMTKFEVSQRLFKSVMKYNPSIDKNLSFPVDSVDWLTAVTFCNEISKLSGLDTCYKISGSGVIFNQNAKGWRLPTEAEWEYAAKDTTKGDYGGNSFLEFMGWFNENSGMKVHNSGFKNANLYGLYDMHGNVWEHCWDWYQFDYYKNNNNTNDPNGPSIGDRRVIKGGSWSSGRGYARSSNRNIPEGKVNNIGLRLVRTKF